MNKIKGILEGTYRYESLRRRKVPLFMGKPGLGKTNLIQDFAKEKGVKLVEMITSQMSPFEISGIGMPDKELKQMIYYNYDKLETLVDGDILFFDELTNGNPTVLNACLTVIEQRRLISGKPLPNVMIIAAGNYEGMSPMTPQIKRRFEWIDVKFDVDMWKKFMNDKYGMPYDISRRLCNLISNEDFSGYNFHTPADHDKAVDTIIHDVYSSYTNELTPILNALVENKLESAVELMDGVFLEPNEKISWLKLKQYELGLIKAENPIKEENSESNHDLYLVRIFHNNSSTLNPYEVINDINEKRSVEVRFTHNQISNEIESMAIELYVAEDFKYKLEEKGLNVEIVKQ